MQQCPKCHSNRVNRSRSKTFLERLRRQFTMKRLFRCEACGWRGWGVETEANADRRDQVPSELPPPDLGAIDETLEALATRSSDTDTPAGTN
jgi:hypothetical protein